MIKLPKSLLPYRRIVVSTPDFYTFSFVKEYFDAQGCVLPSGYKPTEELYKKMQLFHRAHNFCLVLYPYEIDGVYRTSCSVEMAMKDFDREPEGNSTFIEGVDFVTEVMAMEFKLLSNGLVFL